jgi:hypothetical protein
MRHIFLDIKLAFPYIATAKKRRSERDHPPDDKGCDGIESVPCDYRAGTMIEIPRAAMTADEIATAAKFFSFGTNNLTRSHSASPGTMRMDFSPVPFEAAQKDPAREIFFAQYAGGF